MKFNIPLFSGSVIVGSVLFCLLAAMPRRASAAPRRSRAGARAGRLWRGTRNLRTAASRLAVSAICCFGLAGGSGPALAQVVQRFDAVSIKPFRPGTRDYRPRFRTDPSGVHAVQRSLVMLICKAYDVDPFQVEGGDGWTRTQFFNLEAATSSPTTTQQEMLMLRRVLAERFGLSLASKSKMTPVFALAVARGGPRFHELGPGEAPLPPTPPQGEHVTPVVATIQALVYFLNNAFRVHAALGRYVVDQTGLKGRYGIWLTLPADPAILNGRSGIVTHFREVPSALKQIGLELKPAAAPIEIYTIESAHRPTPN